MKIKLSKIAIYLLACMIFILNSFTYTAKAEGSSGPDLKAEAALLVDANSGKILYQKNIDTPLHPASMTKMMTEYILLETIKSGKIKWDQKVSISDYAYKISQNTTLSNVPLRKDLQYTVKELYESMAIYSANGSAIALAELVAGSESNFIKMMADKAAALGLKDSKFVNCTGLNNSDLQGMQPKGTGRSDENTMPARAVATLAYDLLKQFPDVLKTSSIPKKVFREGTSDAIQMDNWNWMLPGLVFGYEGIDGLKTGSTDLGGCSFTGTAKRGNLRFISVVMKTKTKEARFQETKKLMDYGFSNFSLKEIIPAGYKIPNNPGVPVTKGKEKSVEVATKAPLSIVIKNGEEKLYEPTLEIDKSLAKGGSLIAPLEKGKPVGSLALNYKGTTKYSYLTEEGKKKDQVDIVTLTEVKKANWLVLMFRSIGDLIKSVF